MCYGSRRIRENLCCCLGSSLMLREYIRMILKWNIQSSVDCTSLAQLLVARFASSCYDFLLLLNMNQKQVVVSCNKLKPCSIDRMSGTEPRIDGGWTSSTECITSNTMRQTATSTSFGGSRRPFSFVPRPSFWRADPSSRSFGPTSMLSPGISEMEMARETCLRHWHSFPTEFFEVVVYSLAICVYSYYRACFWNSYITASFEFENSFMEFEAAASFSEWLFWNFIDICGMYCNIMATH